ncbi:polysaccharide biosynthesis protein [Arthrobacter sp. AL08]|uniref:polysaccharide biosynthesis protein n=1 Tax=Micrococcaceae TaxID=1268 RepID=UPI00249B5AFF|nr:MULTISPECIES: polysaccharide biosynthesis protein [Micrococcaceae]MDI3242678.1 polysaccharide biosynthesis protein [Arthrobacter sp. AL05]MDI3278590.1 polysaccharide biosynthesis protein [Arthrobacter sp. AL08]MDJ0351170.1 polysaccharide biosynthesis protein [Pseudarthrobacter sp. PH31-O2]
MKTVLLRLTGFAILPLLSLVTPLLLLPVIASVVGAEGISSVISGQAIGTFAATILLWGWNVDGPVAIARAAGSHERSEIYLRSMRTRLLLMILVMPSAGIVAAAVAVPGFRYEAVAMSWAVALAGLSPAWFCIGVGQPRLLALYDTVPRFVATAAAAPVLLLTHQLWYYTILLAVATVLALVGFHRRYSAGGQWLPADLRESFGQLKTQAKTAGISLAGNAYASTPAPIATATTAPQASGSLATADTLYRFGLFTVVALGNAFQGWTIERGATNPARRHLAAIWAHAGLGVLGALILTVLGPFASSLLFAGKLQASTELCAYYGLAFVFLSASTPFIRNLLIPAGRQSQVLRWTLISAVVGVATMIYAGANGNAPGIALGMALSEAVLFVALLIPGLKLLRRERASDHAFE